MIDSGRNETDRKLEELEKEIHGIYAQANKELQEKMTEYFRKFKKRDEEKQKQLENGEITAEEYKRWRMGQMATGSRWKSMCDVIAKDMHNSNAIARSVTQGHMAEIYAINHNWTTYDIENKAMLNTNYAMYNSDVVENLLKENPDILPLLRDSDGNVVREKDIAWNKKVINAVMLQGILQGESIDKMAKRFEEVGVRNEKAAVRYARTATTGAENAGRIDGYRRAQKLGINVVKVWLATLDGRTRDTHRMLDGEEQEVEKEFSNGCMHPGDPNCPDPSEVWNCRCTLITKVDGQNYDVSKVKRDSKLGDMSYQEWKESRKIEEKPEPTKEIKQEEKSQSNNSEKIKELINKMKEDAKNNKGDWKTAAELGGLVMKDTSMPYGKIMKELEPQIKERDELIKRLNELTLENQQINVLDAINKAKNLNERRSVSYRIDTLSQVIDEKQKQALIETIYAVRGDTKGGVLDFKSKRDSKAKKALEKAAEYYPKAWIDKFNAHQWKPLEVKSTDRGYYQNVGKRIAISGFTEASRIQTGIHELGHGMEYAIPGILEQERSFYKHRTDGEELQWLGAGYRKDEKSRFDKFESRYMGKDYGGDSFELVSMGFESVLTPKEKFERDTEMESWVVGLLCGL